MRSPLQLRTAIAAILLLLCAAAASAFAFDPAHGHTSIAADACAVCKAGHLPSLTAGRSPELVPPAPVSECLTQAGRRVTTRQAEVSSDPRAPPCS